MTGPSAVLDACVLVPYRLATTLLWLAEAGLFHPLWSEQILEEVERNLISKLDVPTDKAARRVGLMRDSFGTEAMVNGFDDLIPDLECDPKDRHVLGAAVHSCAEIVVTSNVSDFPPESVQPHGIEVVHPDVFLTQLIATDLDHVLSVLDRETAAFRKPPETTIDFLRRLAGAVPMFANLAADAAEDSARDLSIVPALVRADEAIALSAFGEAGDLTNPRQVALLWWQALSAGDLSSAKSLTFNSRAFGDYQWAADALADRSLASRLLVSLDAPEQVAYMRFLPEVAQTSQVFESYISPMIFITLSRLPDGNWRVWGLGPRLVPTHEMNLG